MAEKKKPRKVLVKVSKLNEEELDKALDDALDALFGPDEEAEEQPAVKHKPAVKRKPARTRKEK